MLNKFKNLVNRFRNIYISQWSLLLGVAIFIVVFCNFKIYSIILPNAYSESNYVVLFSVGIAHILIMYFLLVLFSFRFYAKAFLVFVLITSSVCAYFMDSFATVIDKHMITNIMKTDTQEATELLTVNMLLYIVILGILPSLIVLNLKIKKQTLIKEMICKISLLILVPLIAGAMWLGVGKYYSPFFRNHKIVSYYTNPTFPILSVYKYIEMEINANRTLNKISDDAKIESKSPKIMVFIIGETARAQNQSLNGYSKDTNKFTSSIDNFTSFSDFHSCGTSTAVSVPCMFAHTPKSSFNNADAAYSENLIDILDKVGVETFWVGNNSGGCQGVCDRMDKDIKRYFSFPGSSYDANVLLPELDRILSSHDGDKSLFVVLHIQGSHGPTYFKRYPKEFEHFTPTCSHAQIEKCDKISLENTYDNTIYYTDYLVSEVVKRLSNTNGEKYMWYVSDHGESLGENGLYLHGLPYVLAPQTQTIVPSMIWSSRDDIASQFAAKSKDALSQDYIFSTILGIYKIDSKYYDKSLDLLGK